MALDGGQDGLNFYRILASNTFAPVLFTEIGQGQEKQVQKIFKNNNWSFSGLKKDYNQISRVLIFKKTCKKVAQKFVDRNESVVTSQRERKKKRTTAGFLAILTS